MDDSKPNAPSVAGRQLGDFELVDEIGRGGMGVVYRARQLSMAGRFVALKVLPSLVGIDADSVARFRREAEAAGRLSHPGIVPIYAVGEDQGVHYFAMELVEGPSLHEALQQLTDRAPERLLGTLHEESGLGANTSLSARHSGVIAAAGESYSRSCAAFAVEVAAALAAAHSGRVIHRDIKPSNILMHPTRGAVLVDFGLARDELHNGLTMSGAALGTPSYMAPEQAYGLSNLDGRVDIYGLGATLYEMLTLRPPFDGAHPGEIMRKIVEEEPVALRQLNPRVPVDLAHIVDNCLAKNPDRRYPAAEALQLDLRAFLDGSAVRARGVGFSMRFGRAVVRNRMATMVGAAVLLVAMGAFTLMGWVADRKQLDDGQQALRVAQDYLQRLDLSAAQRAYGQASALLTPDEISTARWAHLVAEFDNLYATGRYSELEAYLLTWPEDARDNPTRSAMLDRVRGHGRLRIVPQVEGSSSTRIRRYDPENGFLPWRLYASDEKLPIGDYIVEVQAMGSAPAIVRTTVTRDAVTALTPRLLSLHDVSESKIAVSYPASHRLLLVDRTEVDNARYARFLANLSDPLRRDELLPIGWSSATAPVGRERLPVVGLSYRQARAYAALTGGHLLSPQEYRLAAGSGLESMEYPWGSNFDWSRVAASEDGLASSVEVESHTSGASPAGILNLVGNVQEILASDGDRPPQLAGGHFQSTRAELSLHSDWPTVDALDRPLPLAGLRVARFAPPLPSPSAAKRAEEIERSVLREGQAGLLQDWRIDSRGGVEVVTEMYGVHSEARSEIETIMTTAGFLQRPTAVTDGHGKSLRFDSSTVSAESSALRVQLAWPARAGQNYRIRILSDLMPTDGLYSDGDAYVLHLPMKALATFHSAYRLRLPDGCHVDEVEPAPSARFSDAGETVLMWDFAVDSRATDRMLPTKVRFRRDGLLAESWPDWQENAAVVSDLFAAMRSADPKTRRRLLDWTHPEFRLLPRGIGQQELVSGEAAVFGDVFDNLQVSDVTSVGKVTSVWGTVDWRLRGRRGEGLTMPRWPIHVRVDCSGPTQRVLSIGPRGRADSGRVELTSYVHDRLRVRLIPPKGAAINRERGRLTEVQVACGWPQRPSSVVFSLTGYRAEAGITDRAALLWLSMGAYSARPGKLVAERTGSFGGTPARMFEWEFGEPGGSRSHEVWAFFSKGRRKFLARRAVMADHPVRARELASRVDVGEFFAAIEDSLKLD